MFVSRGACTIFVEKEGVSYVKYDGPTASAGETGGPIGSLQYVAEDEELHAALRAEFGEEMANEVIAAARQLLAE